MKVNGAFLALLQAPVAASFIDQLRFRHPFGDIGQRSILKDSESRLALPLTRPKTSALKTEK
jgi:hypothetical protein